MSGAADQRTIRAILIVIGTIAVVAPALVVHYGPVIRVQHRAVRLPRRVVPQAELPPVEPVKFVDLSPDAARAFNASVPFSDEPNPAAHPFRFAGTDDDLARATDCLAAAVFYEAGDDAIGERAVAQVVLNRLRHPAFPKTVCGVVFEGSERSTGCQFTFTCDGALTRWTPSDAAWKRARDIATAALAGSVFKPVGYSTHYHTDWVVPYWQSSLDKVAGVGSHLFFRWTGWWGTPPAFNRKLQPGEPAESQLAALSDDHRLGAALVDAADTQALADALIAGAGGALAAGSAVPRPLSGDPDSFVATLGAKDPVDRFTLLALSTCGDRPRCVFMGWTDPTRTPAARPLTDDQLAAMAFSYMRDRATGFDRALWNCTVFPRPDPAQCMKRGAALRAASARPAATPSAIRPTPAVDQTVLTGIRRGPTSANATPSPSPTPPRTSPAGSP